MNNEETVEFTWRLAQSLWREGNFPAARAQLRRVEADRSALSADVVIGTAVMLNIVEQSSEDYAKAVKVLRGVEHLVVVCRADLLTGKWCNSLGATLRAVKDYDGSFKAYESALKPFERVKAFGLAARTRNNIGNLFLSLDQPDIARPYIERAVAECDDDVTLAQFKATEARLLCAEGDYDRAGQVAAESAEYLQSVGETTFAAESLRTLGMIVLAERKVGVR